MATYYIDPVNGSDTYDGSVPDYTSGTTGPWATVQKAVDTVTDGAHTIWLAPGVHRDTTGVTLIQSGTDSANKLYWKGDPNCTRAWDSTIEPGIVRFTCSTTGNVPSAVDLLTFGTETDVEWWDVQLDGCSNAATWNLVIRSAYSNTNMMRRCVMLGGYEPVNAVDLYECVVYGGANAAFLGAATATRSLIMGSSANTGNLCGNVHLNQCIVVHGGSFAVRDTSTTATYTAKNCAFVGGGSAAVYFSGTTDAANVHDNVFWWSNPATRGYQTAEEMQNNFLIQCNADVYTGETADLSTSRALNTWTTRAGTPAAAGHFFELPPALDLIRAASDLWRPKKFGDADMTDSASCTTDTTDIYGMTRTTRFDSQTATRTYPGPWSMNDVELAYDATNGNTIKVYKKGEALLYVPLKKDTATSINVKCVCALGGGTLYPQLEIIVPPDCTTPTVNIDTATGTSEETLTVSVDSDDMIRDGVAKLLLRSRETGTGAYATFYGLTVT